MLRHVCIPTSSGNDSGPSHPFTGITYKGNWKCHDISCHLSLQMVPLNLFWRGLCKAERVNTSAGFDLSTCDFGEDFISGCWRERCLPPPLPHLSLLALSPSHQGTGMGPEEAGGHSFPKLLTSAFLGPPLYRVFIHQSVSISNRWRASRLLSYSAWRC